MGGGSWTKDDFTRYSKSVSRTVDASGSVIGNSSAQEMFTNTRLSAALNPKNVIRECRDSAEHPNTIPVILALDVTGSMGKTAVRVAQKLNVIMTNLYDRVQDIEFMIMGIGDLMCDSAPIQVSQFESDIRIAEQLDQIYFEGGGGGNMFESYTAAWYFGSRHTMLDCWNRGKKGIIITIGDERINPYLPMTGRRCGLVSATGDTLQEDIETRSLYAEASDKFDIYHLDVIHGRRSDTGVKTSWMQYLDDRHFREVNLDSIADEIVNIITGAQTSSVVANDGISW